MSDKVMRSVTSQETWRGTFEWEIQEIDTLLRPVEVEKAEFGCLTSLTSRDFLAGQGTPNESTWQILIRNTSTTVGKYKVGECLSVNLNLVDAILLTESDSLLTKKNFNITCAYVVNVGGTLENPYVTQQHGRKFYIQKGGDSTDIPMKDIYEKREEIFPNNKLIITVKMAIIIGTTNQSEFSELRPTLPLNVEEDELSTLSNSFANLLGRMKFSDITLTCRNRNFPCHKAVLAARSPVFYKKFDVDIEVPPPSVIEIDDVKPEVLEFALKYIYTGKIEFPNSNSTTGDLLLPLPPPPPLLSTTILPSVPPPSPVTLTDLLSVAEKYELTGLKTTVLIKMYSTLNDENAGDFAVAAHIHNAGVDLRCFIMDYCQRRHAILIKNSEYRKNFLAHPDAFFSI